jgi:hypothetical protein
MKRTTSLAIVVLLLAATAISAHAAIFTGDAYRYLNNTAAIQELVKGALEATIRLHANKSTTVDYEIDGEIIDEWDA